MERIATRARAKSRKRSKDPKTDWVLASVFTGASKQQIVDRILGRYASRMDPLCRRARFSNPI